MLRYSTFEWCQWLPLTPNLWSRSVWCISLPAAGPHCHLASAKLYCFVTNVPRVVICVWRACCELACDLVLLRSNSMVCYVLVNWSTDLIIDIRHTDYCFLPRCMENRCSLAMRMLSVCQTRALWQNGRKICPDFPPYDRSFSLVFWEEEWLVGSDPFYLKFWVKFTALERNHQLSIVVPHL